MKRFFLPIIFTLFFFFPTAGTCLAKASPYVVISGEIWLLNEQGEKMFLLPDTYYAPIVGIDETYYTVAFNGVTGKVVKNSVSVTGYEDEVSGTSEILHISEKYSAFTGLKMRHSPENDPGEEGAFIPMGESFTYVGSYPLGEETWYYVCYGEKYGYVLSDFCDKKITERSFAPECKSEETPPSKEEAEEEDSLLKILIISGVAVTIIVLLLVLLLPRKKKKTRYYYET